MGLGGFVRRVAIDMPRPWRLRPGASAQATRLSGAIVMSSLRDLVHGGGASARAMFQVRGFPPSFQDERFFARFTSHLVAG